MKAFLITLLISTIISNCFSQSFYDTSYHQNGKIRRYGLYNKEKKHYLDYKFYYNGNPQLIDQYQSANFADADSVKAYNIDGSFALKMVFSEGKANGDFKEYYNNGILKREGQFYNGFKIGDWKEFYSNGKLFFSYTFSISNKDSASKKELTIFNFDSSYMGTELIEIGEADSTLGYGLEFINILKYSFNYFLATPSGIWNKYDTNGNLIHSINYTKRQRKNLSKRY